MAEAEEAAWAICALRFADFGGRPPAWRKPHPDPDPPPAALDTAAALTREVPRWPRDARGKRSPRSSTDAIRRALRDLSSSSVAAAAAAAARVKRMRASPASPLDYSGGSAASTSGCGGADEGSMSSAEGRVGPTTATNDKVGMIGPQPLIRRFQTPPAKNPRPGKKKKALPELQKEVRSLLEENELLRKEAGDLHRACAAASAENRTLQLRLNQWKALTRTDMLAPGAKQEPDATVPLTRTDMPAPRAKQEPDATSRATPLPPLVQRDGGEGGGFRIPDLNLPAPGDLCYCDE